MWAPDASLDTSWRIGLVLASKMHLRWGSQVVWTYGPLGFLDSTVDVEHLHWVASFVTAISAHVLLAVVVLLFLRDARIGLSPWLLLLVVLVIPPVLAESFEYETVLAAMLIFYLALSGTASRKLRISAMCLGGVLLGLLILVKGTGGSTALLLLTVFVVCALLEGRGILALLPAAACLASGLMAWILSGQQVADIPRYLASTASLVNGYAAAMGIEGQSGKRGLLVVFGVVGLFLAVAALGWLRTERRLVHFALLGLCLLAIDFKDGFVRHEFAHESIFLQAALLLVVLLSLKLTTSRAIPTLVQVCALGVLGLVVGQTVLDETQTPLRPEAPSEYGHTVAQATTRMAAMLRDHNAQYLSSYGDAINLLTKAEARSTFAARSKEGMRATYSLPRGIADAVGEDSVDIFPWDIGIGYAYGLNWRPRPVLQAYSGYTEALDSLDAGFYRGPARPEWVLFAYETIDGRYPLFDEPATIRALARGYSVALSSGPWVLLRANTPKTVATRRTVQMAALGSKVAIAPYGAGSLYASVRVKPTALGTLINLIYKPSDLTISLGFDGPNSPQSYRLVRATAGDGLWLSGFVDNSASFADLMDGRNLQAITSVTVSSKGAREYERLFQVELIAEVP